MCCFRTEVGKLMEINIERKVRSGNEISLRKVEYMGI